MKILITCNHFAVASGRYAYNALKRLGHDVKSQGMCYEDKIWHIKVDPKYIWVPDAPEADWQPDLVIHMDGNAAPVRVGDALHVVYGVDNHVRDYWPDFDWDHLFLVHNFGFRMGEDDATWLPCGYDPVWFAPGPPLVERRWDAAMVGYDYPQRAQLRYALLSAVPGLSMQYGLALYEDYAAAYQHAKISLVRSFGGDVAIRVWETAAMGALLIMDETHDAEALGLEHGVNCLVYRDDAECAQRVKWALTNLDEAQAIASAGQAWAVPDTWDARVQVIVDWAEAHQGLPTGSSWKPPADSARGELDRIAVKATKPKRGRKAKTSAESKDDGTSN
jgi:hypothetical protein